MEEAKIPVFSVLKKGTILKNIFLNSPTLVTEKSLSPSQDSEPILMGRHPDCHIIVDHPSISRFHLEVRANSSLQKLFVTDRSSVHGTWVSGEKIKPNILIELMEGDTIRLGTSTRSYRMHWMPLSSAFEIEKPMSPLIEEASDFIDNDEILQDENFKEVLVDNVIPSAPPISGMLFSEDFEKEGQILIRKEKFEKSSCSTSIAPLLEFVSSSWKEEDGAFKSLLVNEMQPEREELNPFTPDKMVKSSSLLSRRNKSIVFLQIAKTSEENGKGKEDLEIMEQMAEGNVKEEEEESFYSDRKSNRKIERSLLTSFSLLHKEDLEIVEPNVGALIEEIGEEISPIFSVKIDVKEEEEEEEEMCALDEEKMSLNSIGSMGFKSNREIDRSLSSFVNISNKEEEETFVLDEDNMTLVNSLDSKVPRSNKEIETSPVSILCTFNLEEDKPISEATEQFKSNKLSSRSCLIIENGDSKISDAKSIESLFSPGIKLQRSLFKLERSPLGEKKALNVREDMILSDKENGTPKFPKSLKFGKAFNELLNAESEEDETFACDKENLTPQSSLAIKSKNSLSQSHGKNEGEIVRSRKERVPFQPLFVNSPLRNSLSVGYVESLDEAFSNNYVNTVHNLDEKEPDNKHREELPHMPGREKKIWYFVVDAGCFLNEESRKSLQLLEGIRGTQLIIPRIVIRELDHLKKCQGILSRGTKASSVLQWIEQSMMKNSWWIHVQSSSETFSAAPTPPATPRSQICDGSSGFGTTSFNFNGFSACGSLMEIVSPTAEDHILDCALLFKRMKDDGQFMLLTSSTTLRIKAMSEGLLCETPKEFRESLVNPLSKRFLWADSSPRGSTWSCLEEVENYYQQIVSARMPKAEVVKGLKLILPHCSHYGLANSIS